MRWPAIVALTLSGALATLGFSEPARSAPPEPAAVRFLATPRYLLELPGGATADETAGATKVLATLERLATALDREFVAAGVVKEKDLPRPDAVKAYETKGPERLADAPKKPVRWSVRFARTRADMEGICASLPASVNTRGTAFYAAANDSFLGVVSGADGTADLLLWGTPQYVHHRTGLWYHRASQPKGACVPIGFAQFMRWSHLPAGKDFPAELGGIQTSYAEPFRKRAAANDGSFLSLSHLFAAVPKDFDDDQAGMYGPAVLFTEFLWESSPATRKHYIRALRTYAVSGRPVKEFAFATLADELRPVFRTDKELEDAYRAFVATKSAAVNERKIAAK